MIKRLSLLALCALATSGKTSTMHRGEHTLSLFGTTSHGLFRSTGKQDMQWWRRWWQLKPLREELIRDPLALHTACWDGDLNKVIELLAAGASVYRQGYDGWTPLNWTLYLHYKEIAQPFIDHGIPHKEMAELLIAHGAPLNAQDRGCNTLLYWASYYGHKEIAELLIKLGAPLNAQNIARQTPLHKVLYERRKEIAELLIKYGASPDVQDNKGYTPLHIASLQGFDDTIKMLVCASFFPPCSSQVIYAAQLGLQERCLMALDKLDEDAINKHIIPYIAQRLPLNPEHNNDHLPLLIADYAPLKVQQALVTYWQKQASREDARREALAKLNFLLRAHCDRHLKKMQAVLEIQNTNLETPRDVALVNHRKNIVELLDHLKQAATFDELDPALKKAITESIKYRLL